ncbi:MAG: carotenoid biosynthesis protein [Methanobacterium sp.]|nr:carotenoid biosynthesis protein [Methanobacterium sp.]
MIGLLLDFLIVLFAIFVAVFSERLGLNQNFYIKLFFGLFIISIFSAIVSYLVPLSILALVGSFYMWFAFGFVLLHSSKALGNKKTLLLFAIALVFGFAFEANGVLNGSIYGMPYYYNLPTFFFGIVPLTTPISWSIIIYFSYTLTNLFLFGFGGDKPRKKDGSGYFYGMIILLSAIGGLIAMNLDMILDPVAVAPQIAGWVWTSGGPYFGIPIANYIGWFGVAAVAILIFRYYEGVTSKTDSNYSFEVGSNLFIVVLYFVYLLENAVRAFTLGKVDYILIGVSTMMPFILISLLALMLIKKGSLRSGS